jgi:hypothetical protein
MEGEVRAVAEDYLKFQAESRETAQMDRDIAGS